MVFIVLGGLISQWMALDRDLTIDALLEKMHSGEIKVFCVKHHYGRLPPTYLPQNQRFQLSLTTVARGIAVGDVIRVC